MKSVREISKQFDIPKALDKINGPDGVRKPGPQPSLGLEGETLVAKSLSDIYKCVFSIKKTGIAGYCSVP